MRVTGSVVPPYRRRNSWPAIRTGKAAAYSLSNSDGLTLAR